MLSLVNYIKKYQYIFFIILIILIHLTLNNYPSYRITGFNLISYKYLFVSVFSISILCGIFYIVKNYYKKLDNNFYYFFFAYFIILFIYSLIFYPHAVTADIHSEYVRIERLDIDPAYLNSHLVYLVFLWLTSTIYFVTIIQILFIALIFAYFMSFCSRFIKVRVLLLVNLFFLLNPIFLQYATYQHNNVFTNYSILFLGFFLFKSLIDNVLFKKDVIFIICVVMFLSSLARGEAIIIPFAVFFIYFISLYKEKFILKNKFKILLPLFITIVIIFIFKYLNPFYDRHSMEKAHSFLYENVINSVISSPKFKHNTDVDAKLLAIYGASDYPSIHTLVYTNPNIWGYIARMDSSKLKNQKDLAKSLLFSYPYLYLKNQTKIFKRANKQKHFLESKNPPFPLNNAISKYSVSFKKYKDDRIHVDYATYTKKYNISFMYKNMLYVGFIIMLVSILLYRYNPYTAFISILFLSSKVLVFLSAWEGYFMQHLLLYYGIPIILLMFYIEFKVKRKAKA